VKVDRTVWVLSLAVFATMVGNSIVIPFLPLYVHQFGVSEFGAGLLFSVHAATRIVVLPFVGRLSDKLERKTFLLVGVLCYTLSSLAYMPAEQLITFVSVMVIHGTATAVVHPVAMAYVGELAPKGQEGRYSGYINSALLGGIAGGPVLGGAIKDLFGMQTNFWAMAGLSTTALVLLWVSLPETHGHEKKSRAPSASIWSVLACPPLAGVAGFRFGYALANALTWVFLPLLATHLLPLSTTLVGVLVSANTLVSTFLQAPSGRLADRTSKALLICIGGLGSALALALFPWASAFWQLLLLNVLVGAAYGLAFPAHLAVAIENSDAYGMGTVMSVLLTAHGLGMMIGPMIFGLLASHGSLGAAFWGGGVICSLLTFACYPLTKKSGLQPPLPAVAKEEPAVAD
jgi:MFS family permease